MKSIQNYIRAEWKYWLAAVAVVFAMGCVNGAEAKPVLKAEANGVQFYQDYDRNAWEVKYMGKTMDLDETFDEIKVIWKGRYKGQPVILVAGQEGRMCEMAFRLYAFDAEGWVKQTNTFGTMCYAQKVSVAISGGKVHITFDGKTQHVPLK